jgi:hypothetical protein
MVYQTGTTEVEKRPGHARDTSYRCLKLSDRRDTVMATNTDQTGHEAATPRAAMDSGDARAAAEDSD